MTSDTEVPAVFTCPACGFLNDDSEDVAEGWCEKCNGYTGDPVYQIVPPRTWVKLRSSDNLVRHDQDRPVRFAVRYMY